MTSSPTDEEKALKVGLPMKLSTFYKLEKLVLARKQNFKTGSSYDLEPKIHRIKVESLFAGSRQFKSLTLNF